MAATNHAPLLGAGAALSDPVAYGRQATALDHALDAARREQADVSAEAVRAAVGAYLWMVREFDALDSQRLAEPSSGSEKR